jgi:hypothetical protein
MPEETYYCPHCKKRIKKSMQAYLMGESMTSGGHFAALGGTPEIVECPNCGGDIDNNKMMLGEYDARSGSAGGRAFGFIIVAGLIVLAVYFIWFR